MKNINCSNCQATMQFLSRELLQLDKTGVLSEDLRYSDAHAPEIDIYSCPVCKKLDLHASDSNAARKSLARLIPPTEQEPEKESPRNELFRARFCPDCVSVHTFAYPHCPKCGYTY